MTQDDVNGSTDTAENNSPIIINAQYIKDLSFEAPTAPGILTNIQQTSPDIHIDVDVGANDFQPNIYEVVLTLNARCTVGDEVGFILELQYAGLFTLNVEEEMKAPVLMIECPRLLFPFARKILAETSREGGFPPIMISPIDFAGLYQSHLNNKSPDQKEE
ncbi:MAG: protein-export chaperone SecB [Magnetovibrio sp.]|nr:protein-export chaperone SecB [Magnetovibrio sp.]|tara:strand:- start:426 stop:908 length:483 start_codon:yes stop_codon:yes gene_type:complete